MWLPRDAEPVDPAESILPSDTFFAASLEDHSILRRVPFSMIVWHDVGTPSPSREPEPNPPSILRSSIIVRWLSSTTSFNFPDQYDSPRTILSPSMDGLMMFENKELIPCDVIMTDVSSASDWISIGFLVF